MVIPKTLTESVLSVDAIMTTDQAMNYDYVSSLLQLPIFLEQYLPLFFHDFSLLQALTVHKHAI